MSHGNRSGRRGTGFDCWSRSPFKGPIDLFYSETNCLRPRHKHPNETEVVGWPVILVPSLKVSIIDTNSTRQTVFFFTENLRLKWSLHYTSLCNCGGRLFPPMVSRRLGLSCSEKLFSTEFTLKVKDFCDYSILFRKVSLLSSKFFRYWLFVPTYVTKRFVRL